MVKCSMDFPNLNSNPLKGEKELNTFHDKRIVSKIFLKPKKKKKKKYITYSTSRASETILTLRAK